MRELKAIPAATAPEQLDERFVAEVFEHPTDTRAWHVHEALRRAFPERALVQVDEPALKRFAEGGHCTLERLARPQFYTTWSEDDGVERDVINGWTRVRWQGHVLDVLELRWSDPYCGVTDHTWILADDRATAERFYDELSRVTRQTRDEVMVFANGYFEFDKRLYQETRAADWDDLVLADELAATLRADIEQFVAAESTYQGLGVPWKRGILLTGPPGNGKTMCIRALIGLLDAPCIYVRSFKSREGEEAGIREIFTRARQTPGLCVVVLEDLDALVTADNRSALLNELDGMAATHGLLTLATTNHPDRLDTALTERPSRFDMRYEFALPAPSERRRWLERWNDRLDARLQLSADAITELAEKTDRFSFAYLKELALSARMRWMNAGEDACMDAIALEQLKLLRKQVSGLRDKVGFC